MSLDQVVDLLICPACPPAEEAALHLGDRVVRCERRHSFDLARQGYLNLLGAPPPGHADTAEMVTARDRVLSGGAYEPVLAAVAATARAAVVALPREPRYRAHGAGPVGSTAKDGAAVLDCGSGTGHYLAATLSPSGTDVGGTVEDPTGPRGIALDVSVAAARRAARWPLRIGAVVADAWRGLPVRSSSVGVILNVFAPRHVNEFARVLGRGGAVITAHPGPQHLRELREPLGLLAVQDQKSERLEAAFGASFVSAGYQVVQYSRPWTAATVRDVVGMGPNAFHRRADGDVPSPPYEALDGIEVTVAVEITTWRPRS